MKKHNYILLAIAGLLIAFLVWYNLRDATEYWDWKFTGIETKK
jgi:hypothetical protein